MLTGGGGVPTMRVHQVAPMASNVVAVAPCGPMNHAKYRLRVDPKPQIAHADSR